MSTNIMGKSFSTWKPLLKLSKNVKIRITWEVCLIDTLIVKLLTVFTRFRTMLLRLSSFSSLKTKSKATNVRPFNMGLVLYHFSKF